jgi:Na+-driven multidrug efflux pump
VVARSPPIVLTQMSQTVMHVVDSIFVGRLGAAELAALGFAGIWLWTVFSVFSGTATGVQTFVPRPGAGAARACGPSPGGAYAVVPAAALAAFAFAAVADPLWELLGTPGSIREHGLAYLRMRPIGYVGQTAWVIFAAFFRGLGDTRTPLVAMVVANATNAVLAYGLVLAWGCPPGVAGAGRHLDVGGWRGALAALRRRRCPPLRPGPWRRSRRSGASCAPGPDRRPVAARHGRLRALHDLVARMGNASMAATRR